MRATIPISISAAALLVLASASAAHAAGVTHSWSAGGGGNQEWGTAANWDTGVPPGPDDLLVFAAGSHGHNNFPVDTQFESLAFTAPGFLADGNRIRLTGGVTSSVDATTNMDIHTTGDQTWSAGAGATLFNLGEVIVESQTLLVDGAGTVEFRGRLDGAGGVGSVMKVGTGILLLSGGGGQIGTSGLQTSQGSTHVTGMLAGTDFVVTGGTLSGGDPNPLLGVVRSLAVDSGGTVAPGTAPGGGGIATLHTWEPFIAQAGSTIEVDIDGAVGDSFDIYRSATLNSATLHLNVANAPTPGTLFTVVSSQTGTVTGSITTRGGDVLTSGEFVDGGHRWSLSIGQGSMTVEYLGAVPVAPAAPAPAQLPTTGTTTAWVAPLGGLLLATGVVLLLLRRIRSTQR